MNSQELVEIKARRDENYYADTPAHDIYYSFAIAKMDIDALIREVERLQAELEAKETGYYPVGSPQYTEFFEELSKAKANIESMIEVIEQDIPMGRLKKMREDAEQRLEKARSIGIDWDNLADLPHRTSSLLSLPDVPTFSERLMRYQKNMTYVDKRKTPISPSNKWFIDERRNNPR